MRRRRSRGMRGAGRGKVQKENTLSPENDPSKKIFLKISKRGRSIKRDVHKLEKKQAEEEEEVEKQEQEEV